MTMFSINIEGGYYEIITDSKYQGRACDLDVDYHSGKVCISDSRANKHMCVKPLIEAPASEILYNGKVLPTDELMQELLYECSRVPTGCCPPCEDPVQYATKMWVIEQLKALDPDLDIPDAPEDFNYASETWVLEQIAKIKIPTKVSDLVQDVDYLESFEERDPIFESSPAASITDLDINKWNSTEGFSGDYNDLRNAPDLSKYLTKSVANSTYQPIGNYIVTESDPIFRASPAAGITDADISRWNNSVVTVSWSDILGRPDMSEYAYVNHSHNTSEILDLDSFLSAKGYITSIPDTYVQSSQLASVATSGNYEDLINKPTIPSTDGLLSESTADARYQPIGNYVVTSSLASVATSGDYNDLTNKPEIPPMEGLLTESEADAKYQAIGNYLDKSTADSLYQPTGNYVVTSSLSNVALTGNYEDLTNKPEIPSTEGLLSESEANSLYQPKGDYVSSDGLSEVAKTGDYEDLSNKPEIPSTDGLISETTADARYQPIGDYASAGSLANVALTGNYDDLTNKPDIPSTEGLISESDADAKYQPIGNYVSSDSLSEVATTGNYDDLNNKPEIPSTEGLMTESEADAKYQPKGDYITGESDPVFQASPAASITNEDIAKWNSLEVSVSWESIQGKPDFSVYITRSDLASVATSGDYNDLLNLPTIPSTEGLLSESTADGRYQPIGTYITTESDPIFSASPAAAITNDDITRWNSINVTVTWEDITGKPNFDNYVTSDQLSTVATTGDYNDLINKPALDLTPVTEALSAHTSNTNNPHQVTKAQVGLSDVDNTSDLDKPVSTATRILLDLKFNSNQIVTLTRSEYELLTPPDPDTFYFIISEK